MIKTFGKKLLNEKYETREGAYAVIYGRHRIALVRTPKGYLLPGGRIEKNEKMEEALRREVIEELGWEIEVVKYLGQATEYYHALSEKTHFESTGHFFIAAKTGVIGGTVEPDHTLVWMSPEDAGNALLHPYHAWAVRESVKNDRVIKN